MSRTAPTTALSDTGARAGGRLGLALLVIATAQLMMVLDDTVANVALPSIQADLDMSEAALPWVINAYVLTFGGLLLFGGRVGDLYGRLRVLRLGLIVFSAASLAGGLAPTSELLIGARGIQGIGAALVAPNALALIATTFPAGKPRNKAMAVYGAMSALGISGGVLLGGLLTGALSWRWVLLINIPIGIVVLAGTRILVAGERHTGRLDTLGAVSGTAGFTALAYGFTRAGEHGWTDPITLTAFAAAVAARTQFVVLQARSRNPLLPLRLLADRNRSGAYLTVLFIGAGLMAPSTSPPCSCSRSCSSGPYGPVPPRCPSASASSSPPPWPPSLSSTCRRGRSPRPASWRPLPACTGCRHCRQTPATGAT